jgi:hypothetical protein
VAIPERAAPARAQERVHARVRGVGLPCVGKQAHHACALDPDGRWLFDGEVAQDEARLRGLFSDLGRHGRVLVVVDQPNTIGALPIAVARAMGSDVA